MGNPTGVNAFGASRLREPNPLEGVPPAPITPIPNPELTANTGLISNIVNNPSGGTMLPGTSVPMPGTVSPTLGTNAPTMPGTVNPEGRVNTPGVAQNPISDIVGAPPQKMMTEGEWKDQYRQEAAKRAKSPGGGIISDVVAAPTPVTPTPVTPAPVVKPPSVRRKAETDPYERWKQLGRPGGSFENWKKGK